MTGTGGESVTVPESSHEALISMSPLIVRPNGTCQVMAPPSHVPLKSNESGAADA
jgi:hypothetical protein